MIDRLDVLSPGFGCKQSRACLHRQRRHRYLHIELLLPASQHDSAHRRHIAEIASPSQGDVLVLHQAPVGGIEIHPARRRAPHRHPGMRRIGAHQARLAGRGVGQDVAAHVAGGQADRAQAADHQLGKILADAAAAAQDLFEWSRDVGGAAVERKIGEDAVGQVERRVEVRAARGETCARVGFQVREPGDVGRRVHIAAGFQRIGAAGRPHQGAHAFPRQGMGDPVQAGADAQGDDRFGMDQQIVVGQGEGDVADGVAEVVEAIPGFVDGRVEPDQVPFGLLVRERTGRHVQVLLRQADGVLVSVARLVQDAVPGADGGALRQVDHAVRIRCWPLPV
jgi:hypothetical protein